MTKKELIEELEKCDDNAEIEVNIEFSMCGIPFDTVRCVKSVDAVKRRALILFVKI